MQSKRDCSFSFWWQNALNKFWETITKSKNTNFTQWKYNQVPKYQGSPSESREYLKDLNGPCNLSPNEAKRNPSGKEANRLNNNKNLWQPLSKCKRVITKSTGRSKNPRLLRKARCTKPLDALGLKCEIDGKRQTPEGWRSKTRQTRIKNTPVIEKDVARYKSKLRGLENKKTRKVDRLGATVKLQLALLRDWRRLSLSNLCQLARLLG